MKVSIVLPPGLPGLPKAGIDDLLAARGKKYFDKLPRLNSESEEVAQIRRPPERARI